MPTAPRPRLQALAALATAFIVSGVAAPATAQDQCSTAGQTDFVHRVMEQYYLWYRDLPSVNPLVFDGPEAYLEAVRLRPRDDSFSYIALQSTTEAFFSSSEFVGIGFGSKRSGPERLRITQVFPVSPAFDAGLRRGDRLTHIAGTEVSVLLDEGRLDEALGPSEIGYEVGLTWLPHTNDSPLPPEPRSALVVKRPVTIPTVSQRLVIDLDGRRVGYLHFRNFVEPSTDALNEAFAKFQEEEVTELILDLRYNGGGLINVAQQLGGLIGGFRTSARVFLEMMHNDKNTQLNRRVRFDGSLLALNLERVVVITTRASASSSELVINGLKPFIDVTVVGDTTLGKPVGQYRFDFCDKSLFPVSFQNVNADGDGDFFGGIAPDCVARDDLDFPLGDPQESSLDAALSFLRDGSCRRPEAAGRTLRAISPGDDAQFGLKQLINAR